MNESAKQKHRHIAVETVIYGILMFTMTISLVIQFHKQFPIQSAIIGVSGMIIIAFYVWLNVIRSRCLWVKEQISNMTDDELYQYSSTAVNKAIYKFWVRDITKFKDGGCHENQSVEREENLK